MQNRYFLFDHLNPKDRKSNRLKEHEQFIQTRRKAHLDKLRNFVAKMDTERLTDLLEIRDKINSKDLELIRNGAMQFRTYLSSERLPPIQTVVDSGVVPRFVELLSKKTSVYHNRDPHAVKAIRLEAAWVLTNIASGSSEQTRVVVEFGAAPLLVDMLTEDDEEIVDQSIWALGNISGDCERMRDMIIYSKATESLISIGERLLGDSAHIKILRNLTWLLSNLNRGKSPAPPKESVELSTRFLVKLLSVEDKEVLIDGFWAASYICETGEEGARGIVSSPVFQRGVALLKAGTDVGRACSSAIIRMLANIVHHLDDQTQLLVDSGCISAMYDIFYNYPNRRRLSKLRKEICYAFGNIVGKRAEIARYFFDNKILEICSEGLRDDSLVKIESVTLLANLTAYKEVLPMYLEQILDTDIVESLVNCFDDFGHMEDVLVRIISIIFYLAQVEDVRWREVVFMRLNETGLRNLLNNYRSDGRVKVGIVAERSEELYNYLY